MFFELHPQTLSNSIAGLFQKKAEVQEENMFQWADNDLE